MIDTTLVAIVIVIVFAIAPYILLALRTYRGLCGTRVVLCPETGKAASVRLDRRHAAYTAFVRDMPDIRLANCSRWLSRGRCTEPCLPEAVSPESRISRIVARWAERKRCVCCGARAAAAHGGHPIGLRLRDGTTSLWPDLPPDELPDLFRTSLPVCWNCHVAETFRRQHPELVTDRP